MHKSNGMQVFQSNQDLAAQRSSELLQAQLSIYDSLVNILAVVVQPILAVQVQNRSCCDERS